MYAYLVKYSLSLLEEHFLLNLHEVSYDWRSLHVETGLKFIVYMYIV